MDELLNQLQKAEAVARRQIANLYFETAYRQLRTYSNRCSRWFRQPHLLFGTDFPFGQEIGLRYTLRGIGSYPGFSDDDRTGILRRHGDLLLHHHSPAIRRTDHSESMNVATIMILICANVY